MPLQVSPLHPAQRDIFMDQLINIGSASYNIGCYTKLTGLLDKEKFIAAVRTLPEVFDVYKMRFDLDDPQPQAWFDEEYKVLELTLLDFSHEKKETIEEWMKTCLETPFIIKKNQLLFAHYLIKITENEHWYFYKFHHLINDGYGIAAGTQYVARKYHSLLHNPATALKYISYREAAENALAYYHSPAYTKEAAYWQNSIDKKPPQLLERKYHTTTSSGNKSQALNIDFSKEEITLLEELQQQTNAGLQQLTLAALMIYFSRITDQSEFVFGTPVHRRKNREMATVSGMFSGIMPFKGACRPGTTVLELIKSIASTRRQDYRYQNYQTADLNRFLKLNATEHQLTEIIVNHATLNFELDFGEALQGITYDVSNENTRYPLELFWRDYGSQQPLQLKIDFQLSYFTSTDIRLLLQRMMFILQQFKTRLHDKVEDISILPDGELLLLEGFNHKEAQPVSYKTIVEFLETQAALTPDATALVFEEQSFTYKELDKRANQLGHYLRSKGVREEMMVSVCMERSAEMIIGILGVLKAGGVYVPVDPSYPAGRIDFMLEDTGTSIIITNTHFSWLADNNDSRQIIDINKDWPEIAQFPATSVETQLGPDNLAYVIYTSGSTGNPKGVTITHKGLVASTLSRSAYYNATGAALLIPSFSFDSSVAVIFGTLCTNGKLILCKDDALKDAAVVKTLLKDTDTILCVPSYYRFLLEEGLVQQAGLTNVILAGEPLETVLADRHFRETEQVSLYNEYGPTEGTVWSTVAKVLPGDSLITIGKPVNNLNIYILDANNRLLPVGISGELHIGGPQVARGYLNRQELTAEKFIPDPFSKTPGSRLYKTGDIGRWLPDGNIEYQGRVDDQVKIRGYRIELGEVAHVLQTCEGVKQAVVVAWADERRNKRLVGYITGTGSFDKAAAFAVLKEKLPEYMVPSVLMVLEQFPLSTNGKIDKKVLPAPAADDLQLNSYVAPRNEQERLLTGIWQELLGIERIGIYDNFFELGGDSIISMQVVSRAKRLGLELKARDLFVHQTIHNLSSLLSLENNNTTSAEQDVLAGSSGLLPIQQWYFEAGATTPPVFMQHVLLETDKTLTAIDLESAIKKLVQYHDALRFVYQQGIEGWDQTYGSFGGTLDVVDFREIAAGELPGSISSCMNNCEADLDITKGILIKTVLLLMPESEPCNRLLVMVHHLAVDGVSWRILLEDLELLLKNNAQTAEAVLGHKGSSYRQWYNTLADYAQSDRLAGQVSYWEQQTAANMPLLTDRVYDGKVRVADTGIQVLRLDALQTRRLLQEVPRAYHTEINDILLCALALTMSEWNGTAGILVGMEGHGREEIAAGIAINRTVGWFTSQYPVWLEISSKEDIGVSLKEIKEQLRQVPEKGIGYGVLKYIRKTTSLQQVTPWEIAFNYLGQGDNMTSRDGAVKLSLASLGAGGAAERVVPEKLTVDSMIRQGELIIQWGFSQKHYEAATVAQLANTYLSHLESLIAHCVAQDPSLPVHTPSDYGLGGVMSNAELDTFLDATYQGVPRRNQLTGLYRLTGLQEGMLFHGLYDETGGAYIEQFSCELPDLQVEAFLQSWKRLLAQHSIFRSAFYANVFSIPVQCVYREVTLPVTILDYRGMTIHAQQEAINEYLAADRRKGFDFETAPLMRICLIQLEENRYRMQWSYHHMLMDGWSLPVLLGELLHTYESLVTGKALPAVKEDRFGDYIRYQERRDKVQEEQYWRTYMQGVNEGILLPFVSTTTGRTKETGIYKEELLCLDTETKAQIERYTQQHHITLNTLMQGVWAYLLYRYTGKQDVVYGVTVAGRPDELSGIEQRVGLYINTLPLHAIVTEEKLVANWLKELQTAQLQSREHQYASLNEIQRWIAIKGDLFDSLLVFENYPVNKALTAQPWRLQIEKLQVAEQTNYPLSIRIMTEGAISIGFGYNAAILEKIYVQKITRHFEQVLLQMTAAATNCLKDIQLLTAEERGQLLTSFNDTGVSYPAEKTIKDLFEEQAALTPHATAVVFETAVLTYQELDERSNQLAHYLRSKELKAGALVPLCMERSLDLMVSILGILKAGGAYVPVDPQYPAERISHILSDCNSTLIITTAAYRERLNEVKGNMELCCIDEMTGILSGQQTDSIPGSTATHHMAYVMYTSGSTGKPKGVAVTHQNVVSLVKGANYITLTAEDVILSAGSLSFDATTFEYWGTLLNGATLVLSAEKSLLDIQLLKKELYSRQVTKMFFTTSWFNQLVDTDITVFEKLSAILTGGEKLSEKHAGKFRHTYPHIDFSNIYGPTENTTFSLSYRINSQTIARHTPIGRPLNNRSAFILDAAQRLVPVGVAGELYVGGDGVALGYLHLPELTAERFIPHPFVIQPGKKVYRTGDLARWLPDGNIEYLGRIDEQVKIRGFRIEPGETTRVLEQCEAVKQAVVVAWSNKQDNKYLVGYVVPHDTFDRESILTYLKNRLPDYMVPSLLIPMEQLPLTPNGKVDKKALPVPDTALLSSAAYVAPRNATEQTLANIWQELLGIPRIGVQDSFFELGGHSLLAMRLQSALRKHLAVEVPVKAIFQHQTIAGLAIYIHEQAGGALSAIKKYDRSGNTPLSFGQERLWFIDRLAGSVQYHISMAFRLKGHLNKEALAYALQSIVNRHEILRTVIVLDNDRTHQQLLNKDEWRLNILENSSWQTDTIALHATMQRLIDAPFNLSADHMLRAHLLMLGAAEHILVMTMHHIASDGWSISIFAKELVELYNTYETGGVPQLPVLDIQYADYAIWQHAYMSGTTMEAQLAYWKEKLHQVTTLQLPLDEARPAVFSTHGAIIRFRLDGELQQQLQALSRQEGTTLFMTLLAAFKVLLYRYSGQEDICVGSPVSGRTQQEMEGLIGCFVNSLALRSDLRNNPSFISLLQQVKETTLSAYEHQEIPFEKIVEAVVKERDMSSSPLFQVMFVLQNMPSIPSLRLGGLQLQEEVIEYTTAQVDLNFTFEETADGLVGGVEYCTDLFHADTIRRMIAHFEQLLRSIVMSPVTQIGLLPMLSVREEQRLLTTFNNTLPFYQSGSNIVALLEEQAALTPDATALVSGEVTMTYKTLDERSNQLAHYLRTKGVQAEMRVPLCINRSIEMIVGIWGILKAGAAYVPVDPNYPMERISYMLSESNSTLIITENAQLENLQQANTTMELLCLDNITALLSAQDTDRVNTIIDPGNLAYVIYTSGSTGNPKGVTITHQGLVASTLSRRAYYNATGAALLIPSFSFDSSVAVIFGTLCTGGKLILCKDDVLKDATAVKPLLKDTDTILCVPSYYRFLLEEGLVQQAGLTNVILAGEPLEAALADRHFRETEQVSLYNEYGPTEGTVWSTVAAVLPGDSLITIGKPVDNVNVYILDANNQLLPVGISGELHIGGPQVARGYLNRQELTAEKFIPDFFSKTPGSRLYKTGDIGRWLPDGNIEYLGRIDDQVKIRGYRIELGEVAHVLQTCEGVKQAIVIAWSDERGNKRLVGYVTGTDSFEKAAAFAALKEKLPEYMVPSLLVVLEQFPLTTNGKIDKKALPAPAADDLQLNSYVAPRNEQERILTAIWQELLGVERIGIYDNFFELGGHSLLVTRVISAIRRELEVEIPIRELFTHPVIADLSVHIQSLQKGIVLPAVTAMQRNGKLPLSSSQERLWFIDRMEGSVPYHIPAVLRLQGNLNRTALEFALKTIIDRHEVLRTVFKEEEGEVSQEIISAAHWHLQEVQHNSFSDEKEALEQIAQLINTPFDLSEDFMLRAHLLPLTTGEHLLVINQHHIASDGWSASILVKELVELYQSFHQQRPHVLSPLQVQYADYTLWQRLYLQGDLLDKQLAYWKEKLDDTAVLQLPTDYPRPAVQSTRGHTIYYEIDPSLAKALELFSRQQGATLFMTMLSVFKVLLYRYSGQEDICVGSPIANRMQQAIEPLIGFFVNTIALRSDLSGEPDFKTLLARVKTTLLEAYMHQDTPFEKVVEAVGSERDMSRTPLFQVMFILQNVPEIPALDLDELQITIQPVPNITAKFDLTVDVMTTDTGLRLRVEYCSDLYDAATIARMMDHYLVLLHGVVAHPDQQISTLPMLTAAEEQQLLVEFNNTDRTYPLDKSVIDLFEEQAADSPDAPAVLFEGQQYTYRQLNEKANQLAHYLRNKGVMENVLVPVCMTRSLEMITAILGILKAGGTYVPVDPAYPEARIRYILSDTQFMVTLTDTRNRSLLSDIEEERILVLTADTENILSSMPSSNITRAVCPDKLTYLIYTSGSTGNPKGVEMPDSALFNLLCWQQEQVSNNYPRRVLQFASINFDVSFQEIFFALCYGGSLHLIEEQRRKDMSVLMEQINTDGITCLFMPYVVLKNLVEYAQESGIYPRMLQEVFTAGEQLKLSADLETFLAHAGARLHNQYGPTEAHVVSAYMVQPSDYIHRVLPPIGKPISNTKLYILGAGNSLCPVGVPGELYIGGVQVAHGYLHLPELTAERFMADPFDVHGNGRMYKTGDVCCWLPDGNISYLGRKDDQVKIRGNRVEIGEVESVLAQCEQVSQCVVLAKADQYGNKRLVAYIVPEDRFNKEDIRLFLQSRLPDYMIPSLFVELQELPLTNNGKVNKKALPDPDVSLLGFVTYTAARNLTEQQLVSIWESLLQIERVGIYDNFFELGGHSLLAMRLQSALRKKLEVEVSIKSIFAHPTIARLAAFIQRNGNGWVLPTITLQTRPSFIPLSYSQERLWFIDQMEGSTQYHMPLVLRLKGSLDRAALECALQQVINRHEVLRTVIVQEDGHSFQRIQEKDRWSLQIINNPVYKKDAAACRSLIHKLIDTPFDLGKDHMLRAHLIASGEEEYVLVLTMHHIASDGWSISILFRELIAMYDSYTAGNVVKLPVPEIQYADYAIWQRQYMSDELLATQLGYWKDKLTGVAALQLPTDYQRPAIKGKNGSVVCLDLDRELTDQLQTLSQQEGTTLFMTLLAALNVLLYRYSGQEDICVGSPISGRTRQEVEGLVGFFINTLALRNNLGDNPAFLSLLQQVKQTTLSAYEYQEVPFEKIVDAVVTERDMSRSPLFQIMLVLQNTPDVPVLQLGEVQLSEVSLDHVTAVFDLNFCLKETADGLSLIIQYSTDLFSADTVTRMGRHFEQLLRSIVKMPATHICALPMLSAAEEHQLLVVFNDNTVPYPEDKSLINLFASQVSASPDAMAVMFEDNTLTYRELHERSNQLAHYLRSLGVTKGALVPLCIERSLEMIVAMLAIMKAGGAYVPVDQEYPLDRISYILEDTGAGIMIGSSAVKQRLAPIAGSIKMILADGDHELITGYPGTDMTTAPEANDLAYVIYTSGSTGKPKGVLIEHRGVVNLMVSQREMLQLRSDSRILQFASFGFDASCLEIFQSLTVGALLVLPRKEDLLSSAGFATLINKRKIDTLLLSPSYLHSVRDMLGSSVKTIVSGGEALNREDWKYLHAKGIRVINAYGPTENTICTTITAAPVTSDNIVVIGKPVANMQVYIQDVHGGLCPIGVAGEICVSGTGLARGYLNRPELTMEKFTQNPFSSEPESRMYKTGDLGRWLSDGNIEYLGRIDDQVKVRGYRIELGEIENVLHECSLVREAVVMVKGGQHDNKLLVGYVVPQDTFDKEGIIAYLKTKLPDFMIPSLLVELKGLPTTANGKVDKKALPALESIQLANKEHDGSPRNDMEEQLLLIWREVLNFQQLSIYDNFFAAGGNSITAIRLIAKMKVNFQVSINNLFQHPTVAGISKHVIYEQNHFKNKLAALITKFDINHEEQIVSGEKAARMQEEMAIQKQQYINNIKQLPDIDPTETIRYDKILLLGATGYLGIHLLHDLLLRQDADICVLIRADTDEDAFIRLAEKYMFYFGVPLLKDKYRLQVIKGDITKHHFGLSGSLFHAVMNETDCILNTAANVKHYGSYHEFELVNTRSVQVILDHCREGKVKVIHHISTTSVAGMSPEGSHDYLYTEADLFKNQEVPNFYTKSKLEAEKLLDKARESGIQINIYRVGHLSFHSSTGRFQENIDNNAFYNQIKGFISFRAVPQEIAELELSNIDEVSDAILQIFDKKQLLNRNFHIRNPHTLTAAMFVEYLNSYGFEAALMSTKAYIEKMLSEYESKKDMIDRLFLQADLFSEEKEDAGVVYQLCSEETNAILKKLQFKWGRINEEKVHLMLSYAEQVGFFESSKKKGILIE
ncbi:non-ribosomal peptide synthase protein (TIGR01720 family)/amino acid adenylation domain-containing protein/thioester reductase-like protein [Chitinophaga niastensis]|uniref:Non-ribosomal peptide synthase protein (TIGR01720 family)/amino acid adenylation domain-containing protein/thioester reductase-like protein n=1 Tax=Chitinophaga niastensis TaxID=536980 RepID=A0A2P8HHF7_CHINA|nr:non-ribosomal peptide synthase/polyketide synthase [Chitinophaga niastensis]PSL45672.1 non-ribosomal peptide synthase protein (TIGR01720 family)/amino acid adenylation domain-containing protein/thioester reductase-like protein [Chitinophaga niastensis]